MGTSLPFNLDISMQPKYVKEPSQVLSYTLTMWSNGHGIFDEEDIYMCVIVQQWITKSADK